MRDAFSEMLSCDLSDNEVAAKAQELAREVERYEELEALKKAETKRLGDWLKASRERIDELGEQVRTHRETRSVTCYERANYAENRVDVWRSDEGTIFRHRPFTSEEKQLEIDNVIKGRFRAAMHADNDNGPSKTPSPPDDHDEDDEDEDETSKAH